MTSPKTQIQALIHKIDEVLGASNTTQSSTELSEDVPQQQVLEQARNYLASLQGSSSASSERPRLDIAQQEWWRDRPPAAQMQAAPPAEMGYGASPAESAQQVLQAIVQEMNYLRVNMMQPMREELMGLYQQRQFLTADIQRLEQQRHQLLLSQQQINQQQVINDFMQSLMGRLQDQLATQIAQSVENLQFQATQSAGLLQNNTPIPQINPGETVGEPLTPGQRLQQMQSLQAKSDEMLTKLDSTLRVVFESLQGNVDSYQDSLGEGLKKMHGLGQQGEAMFAALVNRLAEQLGRGASQYIQSSIKTEWELPGLQSVENAGNQPSLQSAQYDRMAAIPDKLPEAQIDSLLNAVEFEDGAPPHSSTDPSFLDPVLDDFQSDTATESLDFNLDDLHLPIDDTLTGRVAQADESPSSGSSGEDQAHLSDDYSDEDYSDEMVTLFAIEDEGVVDQVDAQRLSQLEELDADLLLSEINELTADSDSDSDAELEQMSATSAADERSALFSADANLSLDELESPRILDRGGVFSVPDESDEALTFLDQIATEMESDLTSEPADQPAETDVSEAASLAQEATPEPNTLADEIEDIYQMFDSVVTPERLTPSDFDPGENQESQPHADSSDAEGSDALSPAADDASDAIADPEPPALLDDLLFDQAENQQQLAESDTEADLADTLSISDLVTQELPENDDDLFSDLGISTQSNARDASELQSEQVETIHTLSDLEFLDQPKVAGEDAKPEPEETPSLAEADDEQFVTSAFERYIEASPDEDLLADDNDDAAVGSNLTLDSTTMQRLASDLSGFEGIDESEVLMPSDDTVYLSVDSSDSPDPPDSSMAEDDAPEARSPISEVDSESATPENIEHLSDEMTSENRIADDPNPFEFGQSDNTESDDQAPDMSAWDDLETDEPIAEWQFSFDESGNEPELQETPDAFNEEDGSNSSIGINEDSMTMDDLFTSSSDLYSEGDGAEEQFDPLDSDELRQIFEDLKALDNQTIEPNPGAQEQTLVDLLKGVNQPTVPPEPDTQGESEESSAETDTSWSIFDDLNAPDSPSESEQKKNSENF
ncbi:MAG: hypothetical protein WBA57_02965 [Elainellaceae cyanobacterium]